MVPIESLLLLEQLLLLLLDQCKLMVWVDFPLAPVLERWLRSRPPAAVPEVPGSPPTPSAWAEE